MLVAPGHEREHEGRFALGSFHVDIGMARHQHAEIGGVVRNGGVMDRRAALKTRLGGIRTRLQQYIECIRFFHAATPSRGWSRRPSPPLASLAFGQQALHFFNIVSFYGIGERGGFCIRKDFRGPLAVGGIDPSVGPMIRVGAATLS